MRSRPFTSTQVLPLKSLTRAPERDARLLAINWWLYLRWNPKKQKTANVRLANFVTQSKMDAKKARAKLQNLMEGLGKVGQERLLVSDKLDEAQK